MELLMLSGINHTLTIIKDAWVNSNDYVIKLWSVTMWLGIYRDFFMHVHAVSRVYYTDQQAVNIWS